ncbi:MAG: ComF family protein [bacterium]
MFLLDFLFPKRCFVCKRLGKYICSNCAKKFYLSKYDICIYCNKPSYLGLTHYKCIRKYGVDGFIFLYKYNNYLKTTIKTLKYRLVENGFTELMVIAKDPVHTKLSPLITIFNKPLVLSPIPLSKNRINQRGFNQSKIIANHISQQLGLASKDYLLRNKNTKPQAQIKSKILRYKNIRSAFEIKKGFSVEKTNIILVDDVVTTGSTVKESCRVLKRNKALKVFVFALAKG